MRFRGTKIRKNFRTGFAVKPVALHIWRQKSEKNLDLGDKIAKNNPKNPLLATK